MPSGVSRERARVWSDGRVLRSRLGFGRADRGVDCLGGDATLGARLMRVDTDGCKSDTFLEDIGESSLDIAIDVINAAMASCARCGLDRLRSSGLTDKGFINAYEKLEAARLVKELLLVARYPKGQG